MATLPAHRRGCLTWDQGVEMATHADSRLEYPSRESA